MIKSWDSLWETLVILVASIIYGSLHVLQSMIIMIVSYYLSLLFMFNRWADILKGEYIGGGVLYGGHEDGWNEVYLIAGVGTVIGLILVGGLDYFCGRKKSQT